MTAAAPECALAEICSASMTHVVLCSLASFNETEACLVSVAGLAAQSVSAAAAIVDAHLAGVSCIACRLHLPQIPLRACLQASGPGAHLF